MWGESLPVLSYWIIVPATIVLVSASVVLLIGRKTAVLGRDCAEIIDAISNGRISDDEIVVMYAGIPPVYRHEIFMLISQKRPDLATTMATGQCAMIA